MLIIRKSIEIFADSADWFKLSARLHVHTVVKDQGTLIRKFWSIINLLIV